VHERDRAGTSGPLRTKTGRPWTSTRSSSQPTSAMTAVLQTRACAPTVTDTYPRRMSARRPVTGLGGAVRAPDSCTAAKDANPYLLLEQLLAEYVGP
jgi:hypothetical protein